MGNKCDEKKRVKLVSRTQAAQFECSQKLRSHKKSSNSDFTLQDLSQHKFSSCNASKNFAPNPLFFECAERRCPQFVSSARVTFSFFFKNLVPSLTLITNNHTRGLSSGRYQMCHCTCSTKLCALSPHLC